LNVPVNYTVERSQLNVLDKNVTIPPIDINTEDDEGNENTLVKLDINRAKYIDDYYLTDTTENGGYYIDFLEIDPHCFVKRLHYRVNVPTGIQLPIDINAFAVTNGSVIGATQIINDSDFRSQVTTTDLYLDVNTIFLGFQLNQAKTIMKIIFFSTGTGVRNIHLNGTASEPIKYVTFTDTQEHLVLGYFDVDVEPAGKFTPFMCISDISSDNNSNEYYYDSDVYRCTELFSYS
jgi:hypothetical protein